MSKKQLVRSFKNITNGYSSVEIQVRNATSNESWGPSTKELHEIALLTFHDRYVYEILGVLEKRLNDKGKRWRHVMKALSMLLYFVYEGSEFVIQWLREHLYQIKTLREFRYADSRNIDQGAPIRQKARTLTELLEDPVKLISEKKNYLRIREQMGRPGIVELTKKGADAAASRGRTSLDLSRRSDALASPVSEKSFFNGRSALANAFDNNRNSGYRSSSEGRYSLSLLQVIDEEDNTDGKVNL